MDFSNQKYLVMGTVLCIIDLSSIPGLYESDASIIHFAVWWPKMSSNIAKCPLEGQIIPFGNQSSVSHDLVASYTFSLISYCSLHPHWPQLFLLTLGHLFACCSLTGLLFHHAQFLTHLHVHLFTSSYYMSSCKIAPHHPLSTP